MEKREMEKREEVTYLARGDDEHAHVGLARAGDHVGHVVLLKVVTAEKAK